MVNLISRLQDSGAHFKGELAFLRHWSFFAHPDSHFEHLTTTGPYAGTLEAFTTGVRLRTRYQRLLPRESGRIVRFWASDSARVIDTARYFAAGFFGIDWKDHTAELRIIPETAHLGADTLTPGDTCIKYINDTVHGHDYGIA